MVKNIFKKSQNKVLGILLFLILFFSFLILLFYISNLSQEKEFFIIDIPGQDSVEIGIKEGPYARLSRWGGEAFIEIEYITENNDFKLIEENGIVKAINKEKEVHFYRVNNEEEKLIEESPKEFNFLKNLFGFSHAVASEKEDNLRYLNFGLTDLHSTNAYYEMLQIQEYNSPTIMLYSPSEYGYLFYGTRGAERDLRIEDVNLPIGRYNTMEKGGGSPVIFVNKDMFSITLYDKNISENPEEYMNLITKAYNKALGEYDINNIKSFSNTIYFFDGLKPKIVGRKAVDGNFIKFLFYFESPLNNYDFLSETREYLKNFEVVISFAGLRELNKNIDISFAEKVVENIAKELDLNLKEDSITKEEVEIVNSLKDNLKSEEWILHSTRKGIDKKTKLNQIEKFEVELVLKEKPNTNLFEYKINSENLVFWYQGELTEEEKEEGFNRPENIIGSYAVYHKNHDKFFSEEEVNKYKLGKAFHIYRPKIIDASGNEIWGKLRIDQERGILSIEVSQEFLDNANYPVKVDPTFGFEEAGHNDWEVNSRIIGTFYQFPDQLGVNGEGLSISVFLIDSKNYCKIREIKCGIYQSDYTFLNNSTATTSAEVCGQGNFHEVPFTDLNNKPFFESGEEYLLACWLGVSRVDMVYDTAEGYNTIRSSRMDDLLTFPSSIEPEYVCSECRISIYVKYQLAQLELPENLSNTSITTSGFTANWDEVTNAESYTVELHSNDSYTALITSETTVTTSQLFENLNPNTIYYWRVKATANGYHNSDWANEEVITDKETLDPSTNLLNSDIGTDSFTANWDEVTNAESYTVELHSNDSYAALITSETTAITSQSFTGLEANTTYYWRVKATADEYHNSPWANEEVLTDKETLSTPTSLSNSDIETDSFNANWDTVANAE